MTWSPLCAPAGPPRWRDRPLALLAALVVVAPSWADAVSGIRSLTSEPVALPGGVLMLPLAASRPGDRWPGVMPVTLDDGRTLEGTVAWIHPLPPDPARRRPWTADPSRLAVRAIRADDDTSRPGAGTPYLLVRLPERTGGSIQVAGRTLAPTWRDAVPPPRPSSRGAELPPLTLTDRPDRPDAGSPFEYWRWALLAERLDRLPPDPGAYGPLGRLVAEHYAQLWQIALHRLERLSPEAAAEARDLLTGLCTDQGQPVAVWVAHPDEYAVLLRTLLNVRKPDEAALEEAEAWIGSRDPLLAWVESRYGHRIRLAVVNRASAPLVARITWEGLEELPTATDLPPGVLTEVVVDRPRLPEPSAFAPAPLPVPETLVITTAAQVERIGFASRRVVARPPGVGLPTASPPLTLAEVQTRRRSPIAADHATAVQLRRLHGRWEVFFDCRRPDQGGTAPPSRPAADRWADLREQESVTLLIGPEEDRLAVVTIPEEGEWWLRSPGDAGGCAVHRRSFSDRWYARVILPERWIPDRGPLMLAAARTYGSGDAVVTTPNATTAWRLTTAPVAIDLSEWDRTAERVEGPEARRD